MLPMLKPPCKSLIKIVGLAEELPMFDDDSYTNLSKPYHTFLEMIPVSPASKGHATTEPLMALFCTTGQVTELKHWAQSGLADLKPLAQ